MMQFTSILDILIFAMPQLKITEGFMNQEKYDSIYTVENINDLIKNNIPFRDAYKQVGMEVENGNYKPLKEFETTHLGSIHNLGLDVIKEKIDIFKREAKVLK